MPVPKKFGNLLKAPRTYIQTDYTLIGEYFQNKIIYIYI